MRSALISSVVAAIISANSALALESNLTVRSSLSAADLWSKIGDFCGLSAWDPAVERCELSTDGKQRRILYLGGIGSAVAAQEAWDDSNRSFSWTSSSGLPRFQIITQGSMCSQTARLRF